MKEKLVNLYNGTKMRLWFVLNIITSVIYLTWRIFFTIPIGYGVVSVVAGVLLLVVETLGFLEALVHYSNMYNARDYEKPEVPLDMYPDVDIFVATYNEEEDLLKKTLLGCKRMDYPDKSKVHIYLCDDGHREGMKKLAASLGVNYLDREDHAGQKAGNLNNALKHSNSPYVVTFDSDMIPQSCFLMETIPYFVDAEIKNKGKDKKDQIKLGFLQTPQSFYDLDLFQFNLHGETKIPNEQDYFYRDIEVSRTRSNSCIYGGSNTILSREALNDIGGFYTEAITEDFATGILIQKAGYVSLAISKRLASGLSAGTLKDLIQQRVRWARGVISTGRKMHIYTSKDLSFGQKINYWASIWYWYAPIKRLSYIMSPILYATFGFMVFRCTLWQVLLFWLPMYVCNNMSLKTLSNNIRNTKWTSIYEYALFPYMLVPILLETFGFSLKQFKVTTKDMVDDRKRGLSIYNIPIIILIVLSVIGLVRLVLILFESGSLGPIVVIFWLLYNCFSMIMCLFFVDGRKRYRSAERVYVRINGTVEVDGRKYTCYTNDISETGMAVYLDEPALLENTDKEKIYLTLSDGRWTAKMVVDNQHTNENKKKEDYRWLYSFSIVNFESEDSYDQYLALLYDRIPTNPSEIKKSNGMYDDLTTNISRRTSTVQVLKRTYPRIMVNAKLPAIIDGEEQEIYVIDFNYQYFSTKKIYKGEESDKDELGTEAIYEIEKNDKTENDIAEADEKLGKDISFIIGDIVVPTKFERRFEESYLYKVQNFEKLYFEDDKSDEIMRALLELTNKN